MTESTAISPYMVSPGEGEAISWPGVEIRVKAGSDRTGGSFTLLEDRSDAMTVPLHVHDDDEAFYVLEGRYTIHAAGERFAADPGAFVFLPAGVPHIQIVETDGARKLMLLAPAGAEGFFREMAGAFLAGEMSVERRDTIARRHRITFLD
jgi:mannose-6-phosphate isomerase-like protein (cupin superfamily)